MCDPISIGVTLLAGSAVYDGISSSQAHKANEQALRDQAERERRAALLEAEQEHKNFERHLGSLQAAIGGSGADVTTFSEVFYDDMISAEQNIRIILEGGENRAANLDAQAEIQGMQATSALVSGFLNAGSKVFGAPSDSAYSLR
jgi:homoserine kinase